MGIYTKVVSTLKPINEILVSVQGTMKDAIGVYSFVGGQRKLLFPDITLLYSKNTSGSFSFAIPTGKFQYVYIEYAGAAGQQFAIRNEDGAIFFLGDVGAGSIMAISRPVTKGQVISGIVGQQPEKSINNVSGGSGYNNGGNGGSWDQSGVTSGAFSSGGGGSTGVVVDGTTYEASGGSGCGGRFATWFDLYGGAGGGNYGGAVETTLTPTGEPLLWCRNGKNATDPNRRGNNYGSGYVKIWGIRNQDERPSGSV